MIKNLFFTLLASLGLISTATFGQSTTYSFTYDGITRSYNVYLPVNFSSSTSLPLVFNLHGINETPEEQELYTLMDATADTGRFVVVYPAGINEAWNMVIGCAPGNTTYPCTGVDDVGFISALIDTMHVHYNIDLSRVYSCGMSLGGYMTFRLACELSCRIAAVAAVAGLLQEDPLNGTAGTCNPTRDMPVIQMHGTADSIVPYNNTYPESSVPQTVNRWITIDGCPSSPVVTQLPNTNTTDSCTVTENYYGLCNESTQLIQYTVNNGGHTWPDANPLAGNGLGNTDRDISANSVIWNFFKQYSIPAGLTFSGLASSYCTSATAVTLTGSPGGGTFSGTGVSGSQFNPATAGAGTHVITYSITANGCTYTSSQSVTVTSGSSASISGLGAQYCKNAPTITLTGSPTGGTFSGLGVSGSQFDPETAGVGGPYQITYSGTSGGCVFSTSQSVTVDSVPNATFSGLDSAYCLSQNPGTVTLTGAPPGGTFSGTGISGNTFTPATAGAGTHAITYTVTLGNCSNETTKSTTIVASANATITGLNQYYCENALPVTLSASPAGGTFSGHGVSGSQFDPETAGVGGPYQITYSGTSGGCAFSTSQSVTVDSVPNAAFSGLASAYCLSQNPGTITLTGTPSGGTFSGTGVSGNTFNPLTARAGTDTITYTVRLGNCSNETAKSTTIVASANATITGLNQYYCENASPVTISASPAGGVFSGTGISGDQFNPQTAGPGGPYVVSYSGTLAGCSFSGSQAVNVDTAPVVSIMGLNASYCLNASPDSVTVSGTPSGGTFTGPGMSGNQFYPVNAGAGVQIITYSYSDSHNCQGSQQASVTVDSVPVLSVSGLDTFYCSTANPVAVTGTPEGGTFTGQGMSGNQFSPASAGIGTHQITYTYTDGNNCQGTKQANVRVGACTTGIEESLYFAEYSVYPNPAGDLLNVIFRLKESAPLKLVLYDLTGRDILNMNIGYKSEGNISLNTQGIPDGIYFLKLESDNNAEVHKVAIDR